MKAPATRPAAQTKAAISHWTLPDLIDFDYYIDSDEQALREHATDTQRLAKRDRGLYLERIRNGIADSTAEHSPEHRGAALRRWLELRREGDNPGLRPLLPGASFARGQRLVTLGLGVLGCVIGGGVASALLQYDGSHPVNIAWYLFVLVLAQLLLAGTTIAMWALRRSKPVRTAMRDFSLLSQLIRPWFSRVAGWIQRQRLAHVPNDIRDQARARAGLLKSQHALYGPASYLPMLIPAQVFGIGFNLGAIAVTIALEWFSDLAFGWGSALDVQPQTIHDLARLVALPWSWAFGEGLGYPTLEQVAGSRIYLKDTLSALDAGHLRSWRWFLVLAVFTYGLTPRLVLLGLSALTQRQTLGALPFTHQRTQALYARMVTPSLETAAATSGTGPAMPIPEPIKPLTAPTAAPRPAPRPDISERLEEGDKAELRAPKRPEETEPKSVEQGSPHGQSPAVKPNPALEPPPTTTIAADACVLLIQIDVDDVLEASDYDRLQRMLLLCSGWRVAASAVVGGGSAMADQAASLVRNGRWGAPPPRIAIIQDGSQPPITEHLRFLRQVRAAAGDQAQILVALVGDPDGDDPLPPLSAFEFSDWERKIEQMGDPYLRLTMLAPPPADVATNAESTDEASR